MSLSVLKLRMHCVGIRAGARVALALNGGHRSCTTNIEVQLRISKLFTAAARVRRATINEGFFMSIPLSIPLLIIRKPTSQSPSV